MTEKKLPVWQTILAMGMGGYVQQRGYSAPRGTPEQKEERSKRAEEKRKRRMQRNLDIQQRRQS